MTYSASTLATGYGAYIAQPLLRNAVEGYEDQLTEEQAREIMERCLRVLFYRDARSINKVREKNQTICSSVLYYKRTNDTSFALFSSPFTLHVRICSIKLQL